MLPSKLQTEVYLVHLVFLVFLVFLVDPTLRHILQTR